MEDSLLGLAPFLGWLVMKKDKELPWAMRIARWVAVVAGSIWLIGFVVHDLIEWFSAGYFRI